MPQKDGYYTTEVTEGNFLFDARSPAQCSTLVMTNFAPLALNHAPPSLLRVRLPRFEGRCRSDRPMEKECWNAAQITLPFLEVAYSEGVSTYDVSTEGAGWGVKNDPKFADKIMH